MGGVFVDERRSSAAEHDATERDGRAAKTGFLPRSCDLVGWFSPVSDGIDDGALKGLLLLCAVHTQQTTFFSKH